MTRKCTFGRVWFELNGLWLPRLLINYLQLLDYLHLSACKPGVPRQAQSGACCCRFRKHRTDSRVGSFISMTITCKHRLCGCEVLHHRTTPHQPLIGLPSEPSQPGGMLEHCYCSHVHLTFPQSLVYTTARLTATSQRCKTLDWPTNHILQG